MNHTRLGKALYVSGLSLPVITLPVAVRAFLGWVGFLDPLPNDMRILGSSFFVLLFVFSGLLLMVIGMGIYREEICITTDFDIDRFTAYIFLQVFSAVLVLLEVISQVIAT